MLFIFSITINFTLSNILMIFWCYIMRAAKLNLVTYVFLN